MASNPLLGPDSDSDDGGAPSTDDSRVADAKSEAEERAKAEAKKEAEELAKDPRAQKLAMQASRHVCCSDSPSAFSSFLLHRLERVS